VRYGTLDHLTRSWSVGTETFGIFATWIGITAEITKRTTTAWTHFLISWVLVVWRSHYTLRKAVCVYTYNPLSKQTLSFTVSKSGTSVHEGLCVFLQLCYFGVHCYRMHIIILQVNTKLLNWPLRREAMRWHLLESSIQFSRKWWAQ
jgi:hypothetical protein